MVWLATALALTLPQDVQKPPVVDPGSPARDVIVLEGGEKIVGEILKQSGNYIEVRINETTVVGFERSRITSIRRSGNSGKSAVRPTLTSRDNWFLLHGGDGRALGYLHGLVQVQQNGEIHFTEEWFFAGNKGSTRITVLEVVSPDLSPRSCFYHERVNDNSGRMIAESLRRGTVQGRSLVVDWRSLRGREKQKYPFRYGVRFPLAFREEIRQRKDIAIHTANQQVFDPKTGSFKALMASTVQRRKVSIGNRTMIVREVSIDDGRQRNSEWIDANCQTLRREINGAALVAVRTTRARALRTEVSRNLKGANSAIATSSDGRLGLWLPNPLWSIETSGPGSITVQAPLFDATATLIELGQLDESLQLASATDAVIRWLRLSIGSELKVVQRSEVQVRRLSAVQLGLRWRKERVGESIAFKGLCHVFRSQGRYLAFFFAVPRDSFHALHADVARILDSVQLMTEDITPHLQGPLARPGR